MSQKFELADIELHTVLFVSAQMYTFYVNHFAASLCLHLLFLEGFEYIISESC